VQQNRKTTRKPKTVIDDAVKALEDIYMALHREMRV
jgi:hypothetical protein